MLNYYELFGLPACGKSTYLNQNNLFNLNDVYLYQNNRIVRIFNKFIILFKLILIDFKLFCKINSFFSKIKFGNLKIRIKMYLYLSNILFLIKKMPNFRKICYLDEGLLQVLWSILYNSKFNMKIVDEFFNIFIDYMPKNIIYLDTDLDTNYSRLLNRKFKGGSELNHDVKESYDFFEKAVMIRNEILNKCNNYNFNIICIKEEL